MDKDLKQILDRSANLKVEGRKSKDEAWVDINKQIQKRKTSVYITYGMVAATILAFILIVIPNKNSVIETGIAEKREVTLPDQSKVILNAGSSLTFSKKEWKDNRKVALEGEAFFTIEKGKPMSVTCSLGNIEVLGTTFNVYSRNEQFNVECYSGSVKVSGLNNNFILEPNTGVRLSIETQQLEKYSIKSNKTNSWMNGSSYFDQASLTVVFDEIHRQYGYTINSNKAIEFRLYSGFITHESLQEALETISLAMQLSYSIDDKNKQITIENQ